MEFFVDALRCAAFLALVLLPFNIVMIACIVYGAELLLYVFDWLGIVPPVMFAREACP